jgi:hypothetical protein
MSEVRSSRLANRMTASGQKWSVASVSAISYSSDFVSSLLEPFADARHSLIDSVSIETLTDQC